MKIGLVFLPAVSMLAIFDVDGSRCALFCTVPDERIGAISFNDNFFSLAVIGAVADASSAGIPFIITCLRNPPELLAPARTSSGVDRFSESQRPWYWALMTGDLENAEGAVAGVSLEGGPELHITPLCAVVLDTKEAYFDSPFNAVPVASDEETMAFSRPIGGRWRTPHDGPIVLWAPYWTGRIVDHLGRDVPFTPVSDTVVLVNVQDAGWITFTGNRASVLEVPLLTFLDGCVPAISVYQGDTPYSGRTEMAPAILPVAGFPMAQQKRGYWEVVGGYPRFVERPRVLVAGRAQGVTTISGLRLFLSRRSKFVFSDR